MATIGRPSEYKPEYVQVAQEYIASCGREQTALPTIEGLSLRLGADDTTILKWGDNNEDFLATIKQLKSAQKEQLMNDGLYGGKEVNSAMAIFLLKANHDMIETERKQLVGGDNGGIVVNILPAKKEDSE